jgi:hypothetical protein
MNKFKCNTCGGSGKVPDFLTSHPNVVEPCPDCKGSGYMAIGVEEKCTEDTDCDNIKEPNCCLTEKRYYPNGNYKGIKCCKGWLYRPLTSEEVEEMYSKFCSLKRGGAPIEDMLDVVSELTHKGAQVKLIPLEDK